MIPILYPENETLFRNNGIGRLTEAISCQVAEQVNGSYEAELRYPIRGIRFADIKQRMIIMVKPNPTSGLQPFRIFRITKPSRGTVTVYARHVAYDLAGVVLSPFLAVSAQNAMEGLAEYATTDHSFTFETDKDTVASMNVTVPTPVWQQLGGISGSVLDVYGGEYEFDRFTVRLLKRRGADNGVSIRYGKNLTSLEQDENCANCYTGVYPYWVDSAGNVTELPEKILMAEGNYGYTKILSLDLTSDFETAPTEEQLRSRGKRYMSDNDIGTPTVSMDVSFVQLEQTEEYKGLNLLERVAMGDTVHVEFPEMGVSASARVVSYVYDSILERYEKVTLGKVRANIADTIAGQKDAAVNAAIKVVENMTQEEIFNKLTNNGQMQGFYQKDGKLYINAEFVQILNLVAQKILSVLGESAMQIDGASLTLTSGDNQTAQLNNQSEGLPIFYMTNFVNGQRSDHAEMTPRMLKLGGTSASPVFYVNVQGGVSLVTLSSLLPDGNGNCEWKYIESLGEYVLARK